MNPPAKTTILHAWHLARGAKLSAFGGYDMPLWYASAKSEHLAVLTHAGLFDTSHMAVLAIDGAGAHDLLQLAFTQNLAACIGPGKAPLAPGRSVYGAFLNPDGETIDDSIVFKIAEGTYLAVVNAGMGPAVARHLAALAGPRPPVRVRDLSEGVGKIDIQGPRAGQILTGVLAEPRRVFSRLPYFAFKGHFDPAARPAETVRLLNGTPVLLSRTGYTGEFGFEIFLAPEKTVEAWELILEAGRPEGLIPCGLAARDSLRAGAVLPLSHQDIGAWPFCNHPWTFALPLTADRRGFTKAFIGDRALLAACAGADFTLPFVGFDPRKVTAGGAPGAAVIDGDGRPIGRVLTCVTDMGIDRDGGRIFSLASPDKPPGFAPRGLACGFVRVKPRPAVGTRVELRDGHRSIAVEIVDDIRPHRTARRPLEKMIQT
jgi:aminomethyltransferase